MGLCEHFFTRLLSEMQVDKDAVDSVRRAAEAARERGEQLVYVMRQRSLLEAALLRRFCRANALPKPDGEEAQLLFLRERTGHELTIAGRMQHRNEIRTRIERLTTSREAVHFVPVAIFAGLGPRPLLRPVKLPIDFRFLPLGDVWLSFVLWAQRSALRLDIGPALQASRRSSALEILRRISLELYRKEKVARGPAPKSTETVETIVLSGEQFEALLQEQAVETAASREQVYEAARRRFKEIAARMHGGAIRVLYRILHPVVRAVFESVEVEGLERLREEVARRPTILLPSHKSHFDYILMGWVLYHENLPLPYVAAGANLNFFPAGPLLKAAGGFFIRRKIGDDRLYKFVLDRYLQYLVKQGHLVAFYIEGGRSRTGTVRSPRLGLLKYLVEGWEEGGREDVAVVPIGISYEKIAEEEALIAEQKGARKRPESMLQVLRLKGIRRRNFGSVMIKFGEPYSLKHFYRNGAHGRGKRGIEDLGYAVSRSIMRCTAMTSTALSATSLLSFVSAEGEEREILRRMQVLLQIQGVLWRCTDAGRWRAETTFAAAEHESAMECLQIGGYLRDALKGRSLQEAMELSLGRFVDAGYAEYIGQENDRCVRIRLEQYLKAAYYKNTTIQFFAPAAVIAQAGNSGSASAERIFYELHQFLKPAFLLPFWRVWREELVDYLQRFVQVGWLEEGATLQSLALTSLGHNQLSFLSQLLYPYLLGLLSVVTALEQAESEGVCEETLLKNARDLGNDLVGAGAGLEAGTPAMLSFALEVLLMREVLIEQAPDADSYRKRMFKIAPERQEALNGMKTFLLQQLQVIGRYE